MTYAWRRELVARSPCGAIGQPHSEYRIFRRVEYSIVELEDDHSSSGCPICGDWAFTTRSWLPVSAPKSVNSIWASWRPFLSTLIYGEHHTFFEK
jgi:hypothetical protein